MHTATIVITLMIINIQVGRPHGVMHDNYIIHCLMTTWH